MSIDIYKRSVPVYAADMCRHEPLALVHDREGHWRGLFCEHCQSFWYMSDIGKGPQLLERERLNAPD